MNSKKIRIIGAAAVAAVWLGLTAFAWFAPSKDVSEAERRPLAQFPELSIQTILDGKFMTGFEDYTLAQFPGRDIFRQLKALFHYNVLRQGDNNDIYIVDGYAAKMEYPLSESAIAYAMDRFNHVYEKFLKGKTGNIYSVVVPDKGYYLAEENGYLSMDYEKLFSLVEAGMPWAAHVDVTDALSIADYYRTDTHWRQEKLLPAAQKLAQAMGVTAPKAENFTVTKLDRPFYGVYYGQAALPMAAEEMFILESDLLKACKVKNHENNQYADVYDMTCLQNRDQYDVFLSGSRSLLTIENPNAKTDKELVVFRDSFGSSMVPLLVQDYQTVTVVDIRYLNSAMLGRFVDFHGQGVLFLYSTLVLNNSSTIK